MDVAERHPLTAPGVPREPSDKERAVRVAQEIIRSEHGGDIAILARQYLRVIGHL